MKTQSVLVSRSFHIQNTSWLENCRDLVNPYYNCSLPLSVVYNVDYLHYPFFNSFSWLVDFNILINTTFTKYTSG